MNNRLIATILGIWLSMTVVYGQDIHVTELPQQKLPVMSGQYSGITHISGDRYAVVDDKLPGGGIVFFDIPLRKNGTVRAARVRRSVPDATVSSDVAGLDNEGIVYADGKLYVSAEGDQSIREYTLDGQATGRSFSVPAEMGRDAIHGNAGFEPLTYHAASAKFWTTTELPLKKEGKASRLHRLHRFDAAFQPDTCFLYQMDEPSKTAAEAASARAYVYGIPALAALDDGRLIVLEREVYVPYGGLKEATTNTFCKVKLYLVDPAGNPAGILPKQLLYAFETGAVLTIAGINMTLANYEGMCLGPRLPDGRRCLIFIADSQAGMPSLATALRRKRITHEYVKVLLLETDSVSPE